ncbi:hypothetical protein PUN28_001698 [Cardiocondyla obscurior]|uniref:Uncharacterized protein n=1 Tax=Cardiocondyla obscurior TaxID=286306 RepID=A0AAW2GQT8_9HYME
MEYFSVKYRSEIEEYKLRDKSNNSLIISIITDVALDHDIILLSSLPSLTIILHHTQMI